MDYPSRLRDLRRDIRLASEEIAAVSRMIEIARQHGRSSKANQARLRMLLDAQAKRIAERIELVQNSGESGDKPWNFFD